MSCCETPMPDYSQIPCREVRPMVSKIRLYKRVPRKLKKKQKKYQHMVAATMLAVNEIREAWAKLDIDLSEPLSNYPSVTFNTGDEKVYTFEPFNNASPDR